MRQIYVTKPSLPPLEELIPYLEKIWNSRVLTNGGRFHQELEEELATYLGVPFVSLFTNATIGLMTSIQSLRLSGEVITPPFSFVATSHALLWNAITPVFVDVDRDTFNIQLDAVERAITPKTSAILAVHCYGNPCDVDSIDELARRYSLRVIYDAAHAFGVTCHCGSVLRHGDLSVLSFHATKTFNTFEGGAVVSQSIDQKKRIDYLKNFGFIGEERVIAAGINGKMSEFNAALGLLQLKYLGGYVYTRKALHSRYVSQLKNVEGIECPSADWEEGWNYSYFPIIVNDTYSLTRDELHILLRENGVFSRRYFWPLISTLSAYRDLHSSAPENLPNATWLAERVICLPIFESLEHEDVDFITGLLRNA